jgi:hypothetical protein
MVMIPTERIAEMNDEIFRLKAKIETLEAEIVRLSDPFLHAPDWAEWFAIDKSSNGFWYENEPLERSFEWFEVDCSYMSAGCFPDLAKDWKNSKVKRQHNTGEA